MQNVHNYTEWLCKALGMPFGVVCPHMWHMLSVRVIFSVHPWTMEQPVGVTFSADLRRWPPRSPFYEPVWWMPSTVSDPVIPRVVPLVPAVEGGPCQGLADAKELHRDVLPQALGLVGWAMTKATQLCANTCEQRVLTMVPQLFFGMTSRQCLIPIAGSASSGNSAARR